MRNLIEILFYTIALIAIMHFVISCKAPSGHKSQTWQPHHSNKGGQQYKR